MKKLALSIGALVLGVAMASSVLGQGRHDEKPHGTTKPSAASETQYQPMPGGRHDEKPHGPRKPVAKKADQKKAEEGNTSEKK